MKTLKTTMIVAGALCLLSTASPAAFLTEPSTTTSSFSQFSSGYRDPARLQPAEVRALQQSLAERGFYNGRFDGVWGMRTSDAIKAYQHSTGSTVTGNVNLTMLDDLGVTVDEKTHDDMMQSEATVRRNERSNEH